VGLAISLLCIYRKLFIGSWNRVTSGPAESVESAAAIHWWPSTAPATWHVTVFSGSLIFCRDSATHIRLAIGGVSVYLSVTRWYWLKTNKCIGDDTKAAARRSPNCVRKTKIRRRTMVVWILLPFAIWPDCSNLRVQVPKFHPNRTTRGAVMTSYTISRCRLRWLVSVSYLMMSLSSKGQNLSANQI